VAQAILAALITIGFFTAMFLPGVVPGFEVDEALKQTLVTMFILVIGYYFGSSSGSAKKDEVIASQANTLSTGGTGNGIKIDDTTPVAVKETK
jgi:hypothetical protein